MKMEIQKEFFNDDFGDGEEIIRQEGKRLYIDKFNYWLEALPFYMNVQKEGVILSESKLVKLVEEYINKK